MTSRARGGAGGAWGGARRGRPELRDSQVASERVQRTVGEALTGGAGLGPAGHTGGGGRGPLAQAPWRGCRCGRDQGGAGNGRTQRPPSAWGWWTRRTRNLLPQRLRPRFVSFLVIQPRFSAATRGPPELMQGWTWGRTAPLQGASGSSWGGGCEPADPSRRLPGGGGEPGEGGWAACLPVTLPA